MSGETIGDILTSKAMDVETIISEVAVLKHLIKERVHPLDLVREMLSNSGANEVGATQIEISYTKDKEGHIFEISDDGCGMNYTGDRLLPGRLDKFLGLGLSGIVGIKSDEFSWKGIGSKLSFHSRRVEIDTCFGAPHPYLSVRINEPWQTIENNRVPRAKVSEYPPETHGTKIRVVGHPPHRLEAPFSFQEIKTYLLHRTFAGFTKKRESKPQITLSVLGQTEMLDFGFPEFADIDFDSFAHDGLKLDVEAKTLFINMGPRSSKSMKVLVKGFLTWEPDEYELSNSNLNTGLILSVKGIPYFSLNMEDYGVTTIRTARPGEKKVCLIVECDAIQDDMNISRSGLVDSPKTQELKRVVADIFQRIETSKQYLTFRTIPEKDKQYLQSDILLKEKKILEDKEQNWVVLERPGMEPLVLLREPRNEQEVNILIWKLEALDALPFQMFKTLAYIGAAKGPDILVNFQEDKGDEPQLATVVEVENNFYNYAAHGHAPAQYPKVICWDIPSQGRKIKLNKSPKPHKYTVNLTEYQLHVFVLKQLEVIKVRSREELDNKGIKI